MQSLVPTIIAVAMLAGCASTRSPVEEHFDEGSGLTWVSMDEPIVLARTVPLYTVAARDYLYIGPIETNRLGEREHYLWLGLASTVDRSLRGDSAPGADKLLLLIDGTPVAFALSRWVADFEAPHYDVKVPLAGTRRARVSLNQIHRIAEADSLEVHVLSETGASARYELWQGNWPNWGRFPGERF